MTTRPRQIDVTDPWDAALFYYQLYQQCPGELPPALRDVMDMPSFSVATYARNFSSQFGVGKLAGFFPDEFDFKVWGIMDASYGNGKGWSAIMAYKHFERFGCGMDFIAYARAMGGHWFPPNTGPGVLTRIAAIWSENARQDVEESRVVAMRLREVHRIAIEGTYSDT